MSTGNGALIINENTVLWEDLNEFRVEPGGKIVINDDLTLAMLRRRRRKVGRILKAVPRIVYIKSAGESQRIDIPWNGAVARLYVPE